MKSRFVPKSLRTLYTQQAAMSIYGYQPLRALQILDSAVIVGNLSEFRAEMLRSKIYSSSLMHEQLDSLLGGPEGVRLDSARAIGERIYDLGGRQISAPVKGVNIINGQKVLINR